MRRRLRDENQDIEEVAAVIPEKPCCFDQIASSSSSLLLARRKYPRGRGIIIPPKDHSQTTPPRRRIQPGLRVVLLLTPLIATMVFTNTAIAAASPSPLARVSAAAAFRRRSSTGIAWIRSHRQHHRFCRPVANWQMQALKLVQREGQLRYAPCAMRATVTSWSTRMYSASGEARFQDDRDGRRVFLDDDDDDDDSSEGDDRPFPPALNALHEDEGFGAFDYQPDNYYEWQSLERQELLLQQERHDVVQQLATTPPIVPQPDMLRDKPATTWADDSFQSVSEPVNAIDPDLVSRTESSSYPREGPPSILSGDASNENKALDSFLSKASSGYGVTTTVDVLEGQLEQLQNDIFQFNQGGKPFNVNSHAQVSRILFGTQGGSTEKSVLEAKAASGNRLADLILQYRSVKQQIARLKRKQDNVEHGRQVRNPSSVARTQGDDGNSRVVVEYSADPLLLVDASSYIFRAYYSMPPIHRGDGMPTGAVLGFCNMLNKLALSKMLLGETPRLVLVFDCHGKTFRHQLYPDYKSHRPEAPVDLIPQFALVRQAARAYGMCVVEAPTYEADDVIATLAHQALKEGLDVNIFSGDKDLLQLVTDQDVAPSIHMIDPASMARYTYQHVVEKWGIPPNRLGDVLALAGDSADNVPGVPGIGPKIAAQLMQEFGTLENLLHNTDRIPQKVRRAKLETFQDQARLSRVLVELRDDVPWNMMTLPEGVQRVSDLRMEPMDADRLMEFYDAMGFVEIRRRLENRLLLQRRGNPANLRSRKAKPRPKTTIPRPDEYEDVPF